MNHLSMHHIGFAVRSQSDARMAFEAMGAHFFHASCDVERNLDFQFALCGGVMMELVSPRDSNVQCVVTGMAEKSPCTLYHVCFQTDDLESELGRLKKMGFKQMGKVRKTDVYGYDADGVFLFNMGMGLIELVERCRADE